MLGLKDVAGAIQNEKHRLNKKRKVKKQKEYEKKKTQKTNKPKTDNLISNGKVGMIGFVNLYRYTLKSRPNESSPVYHVIPYLQ
jgi:hypothetical protein